MTGETTRIMRALPDAADDLANESDRCAPLLKALEACKHQADAALTEMNQAARLRMVEGIYLTAVRAIVTHRGRQ